MTHSIPAILCLRLSRNPMDDLSEYICAMLWSSPKTVSAVVLLLSLAFLNGAQAQDQPDKGHAVILGCLDPLAKNYSKELILVTQSGDDYRLTGATKTLQKYLGSGIRVEGTKDESTTPLPTLQVSSFKKITVKPPRLSPSFNNSAAWRVENNQNYGLNLSHPQNFSAIPDSERRVDASFPVQTGTFPLSQFEIPGEIYPGTNFEGGNLGIFVNTAIGNREKCEQFGASDRGKHASVTLHEIRYSVSVNGYVDGSYYDLHTFQNGLCYEFAFSFSEAKMSMENLGCIVPFLSENDRWKIIRHVIQTVTFVRPGPSNASLGTATDR